MPRNRNDKEITLRKTLLIGTLLFGGIFVAGCRSPQAINASLVSADLNVALGRSLAASSESGLNNAQSQSVVATGSTAVVIGTLADSEDGSVWNISLIRIVANIAGLRSAAASSTAGGYNQQEQATVAPGDDELILPLGDVPE